MVVVHKLGRQRLNGERGSIIVIVALSLVALLGFTALVVDLGNGRQKRRQVQSAADASALAGAQEFMTFPTTPATANWNSVASTVQQFALQNAGVPTADWASCADSKIGSYTVIPSTVGVGGCVSVDSVATPTRLRVKIPTRTLQTTFARVLGINSVAVGGEAIAQISSAPGPLPCGLCLLGLTGLVFSDRGTNDIIVNGSNIFVNGNADIRGNSSQIIATAILIHGTIGSHPGVYTPAPTDGGVLADPLAYLVPPSFNDQVVPPNAPASGSLGPGTYKNVNANGRTLAPGLYTITGTLSGSFNGQGVLFYFPSCLSHPNAFPTACSTSLQGGLWTTASTDAVVLSPPTAANCVGVTCAYKGLSLFYDRDNGTTANPTPLQLWANASSSIAGTIYGLNVQLIFGGGPNLVLSSAIVVGSYAGSGSSNLTINYDQSTNVQPPTVTAPNLYR